VWITREHIDHDEIHAAWTDNYHSDPYTWRNVVLFRIAPISMWAYASHPGEFPANSSHPPRWRGSRITRNQRRMAMRYWIGITDYDWFQFLGARPELDEVNFWQPSPRRPVTLEPGAPFLFKLHAEHGGAIVGGGLAVRFSTVPIYLAWEAFEQKNGAASLGEMAKRIQRYRREPISVTHDEIGCWILSEPFFLPRGQWIAPPDDWAPNIVQGKTYDDQEPIGARVWQDLRTAISIAAPSGIAEERYGAPVLVRPRLGQGGFRIVVTDAYDRRCAITAERTLPALDAAHIIPYGERGEHRVDNGLLLRKDLHALFDAGYVSVTPDFHVAVSRRIREEYENGRDYYALAGRSVRAPSESFPRPNPSFLDWHYNERYLG
jgi:putative restriction endonuclease